MQKKDSIFLCACTSLRQVTFVALDLKHFSQEHKLILFCHFCRQDQQINRALEQRVVTYYNYMWLRTKGVDPNSLFDGLPLSMKAEVALDIYADMINKVKKKKYKTRNTKSFVCRIGRKAIGPM